MAEGHPSEGLILGWAELNSWTAAQRACEDLGLKVGQCSLFSLTPGLGTRSGFTLPVFFGQECKPQWLLFFGLYKIHWGGSLGIHVPGHYLEILVQEIWAGLQPNQPVVRPLGSSPAGSPQMLTFLVEIVKRVPVTSPQTRLGVCSFPHQPQVFIFPKYGPNELWMGLFL